jgi:hypothetical protein
MLNIRCYFELFIKLAKLYMEIDLKYIKSGLVILGDMQVGSVGPDAQKVLQAKQAEMNGYTNDVVPKIKEDIAKV